LIAGDLPSFDECKQLDKFDCSWNKFTGMIFCADVYPVIQIGYLQSIFVVVVGELPSFNECKQLTQFGCTTNKFTGILFG